jgi:Stress responsive A/B Barrel Domain
MIRNVVVLKARAGTRPEQLERIADAMLGLQVPGIVNISAGADAGLREGNLDLAVVVDLEDEEAYRAYDADPEHNRIRRELVAPVAERVERVQYRVG